MGSFHNGILESYQKDSNLVFNWDAENVNHCVYTSNVYTKFIFSVQFKDLIITENLQIAKFMYGV